ncbi:ribonuclease H-like protein [Paraphaeosphaeria sporulosa]|uniref:Ribonuclease H-like protein n=1 Tax=Paraphaeosphaeria sporulosa TaxID=1460663 RepID=A0A177CKX1_9PLEO|nr:ribonuclease H-like protein [Paraphaeosphaeria sporulosa]OAG07500.1 ribonuclease H-like protein [Paraphaeosphaeria sporulosa]
MPPSSIFPLFLTKKGPTVKAVQEVLQRIGEASAGTKDVVQNRLLTRVLSRKLPQKNWPQGNEEKKTSRILSIDMGIKNLAYCVADVEKPTSTPSTTNMDFLTWCRLDIGEAFRKSDKNLSFLCSNAEFLDREDEDSVSSMAELEDREDEELYTPENLSQMGYWFLRKVLNDWNPDVILIERQRWRSAGSPTIQQWTVRVNTLEAVMWAVMTAMKTEREKRFHWRMHAVDPKRVGHFWLDGVTLPAPSRVQKKKDSKSAATSEENNDIIGALDDEKAVSIKKLTRGKAEKKAKIQLLRTWLDSEHPSTALATCSSTSESEALYPNINFTFSSHGRLDTPSYGADGTRQALLYATDTTSERAKRTRYYKDYVRKVDDITDCFLQAAAWVAWDENLRRLEPEAKSLMAQVEEKLGREVNGRLADGVKEVQASLENAADGDETAVRSAIRSRKAKTKESEGLELVAKVEEPTTSPRTKRKTKKSKSET